ncbi:hypothetical protein E3N88_04010 [Mikania micrantha]|uniref:Transferase, Chloramphenicol acetyltransferase-like domain protein n=1 Tax=Mikania micrantha TaxID=192012 RepID=A0A5N6PTQ5_9ASTR|nr:hypothetical protein E3N88_04010 [Mikania micrantha]
MHSNQHHFDHSFFNRSFYLLHVHMGIGYDSFLVKVVKNEVVHADQPWTQHWLPFTNFDLLVPPLDVGSIFFYKKPSHGVSFSAIVDTLKASLSRTLTLYPPMAGVIAWNEDAGENQIHCNNGGVCFIEAVADAELKELNFYNPDECVEGKLMPKKLVHGVLVIQVTKLKCDGIVIGVMLDHRIADGYSANMFISSWANMTRTKPSSMIPSFGRSYMKPRSPTIHSRLIENVFVPFSPPSNLNEDLMSRKYDEYRIINRVYYIDGQRFETMDAIDFGWGKVTFGSCHLPSERSDCFVMTMGSPKNNEDWVVYMHMPMKHMSFIEAHASHVFKPLNADYIQI